MIKIIATDMDGTLLDDKKQLPENFEDVIHKLLKKNIRFVISSGRSFGALKKQFNSYLDSLTFICDNGAYIVDRSNVLSVSVMEKSTVDSIISYCEKQGYSVLLCGKHGTWYSTSSADFADEIAKYYVDCHFIEDLHSCSDEIFQVAVFYKNGYSELQYDAMGEVFSGSTVQLSDKYWVDIMNSGINKGSALSKICNRLGVGYNEVMAFGDYLNDVDMLGCAYYSFAMSNAHNSVKRAANFITGSNNDNSVMKEVKKYCLQ